METVNPAHALEKMPETKPVFTITAFINLLLTVKELEDYSIDFIPYSDGSFKILVGQSEYKLSTARQGGG